MFPSWLLLFLLSLFYGVRHWEMRRCWDKREIAPQPPVDANIMPGIVAVSSFALSEQITDP